MYTLCRDDRESTVTMSSLADSPWPQPRAAELEGLIQLIRHDRTNALLVVEGYLEIIRSLDDELPLAAADALGRAVDQLTEHIDGLFLAWALDSGSVAAEYGPVELTELLASAIDDLGPERAAATQAGGEREKLVAWSVASHLERAVRNALVAAHRSAADEIVGVAAGGTADTTFIALSWVGPRPSEGAEDEETLDAVSALELYTSGRLVELAGGSVTRTTDA